MKAIWVLTFVLVLPMLLMSTACEIFDDDDDDEYWAGDDCFIDNVEELTVDDGTAESSTGGTGTGSILLQGGYDWPEVFEFVSVSWYAMDESGYSNQFRFVVYVRDDSDAFGMVHRSEPVAQSGESGWNFFWTEYVWIDEWETDGNPIFVGFEFETSDSPLLGLDESGGKKNITDAAWLFDGDTWLNLEIDLNTPGALMIQPRIIADNGYDDDDDYYDDDDYDDC
jgi:hypothetical protein